MNRKNEIAIALAEPPFPLFQPPCLQLQETFCCFCSFDYGMNYIYLPPTSLEWNHQNKKHHRNSFLLRLKIIIWEFTALFSIQFSNKDSWSKRWYNFNIAIYLVCRENYYKTNCQYLHRTKQTMPYGLRLTTITTSNWVVSLYAQPTFYKSNSYRGSDINRNGIQILPWDGTWK